MLSHMNLGQILLPNWLALSFFSVQNADKVLLTFEYGHTWSCGEG